MHNRIQSFLLHLQRQHDVPSQLAGPTSRISNESLLFSQRCKGCPWSITIYLIGVRAAVDASVLLRLLLAVLCHHQDAVCCTFR